MLGLKHCHDAKISHRDLKPENVFIENENFVLKLADFGFAGPVEGRDGSGTLKTKLGTLNYMAPEIFIENGSYDKRVDIWSLGMTLYSLIFKDLPFKFNDEDIR